MSPRVRAPRGPRGKLRAIRDLTPKEFAGREMKFLAAGEKERGDGGVRFEWQK
jgi:hypothetical protein